jgi:hypothetical protein
MVEHLTVCVVLYFTAKSYCIEMQLKIIHQQIFNEDFHLLDESIYRVFDLLWELQRFDQYEGVSQSNAKPAIR